MDDQSPSLPEQHLQILPFEIGLVAFLNHHNLPKDGILASLDQRQVMLRNLEGIVSRISGDGRLTAVYLSKCVVAVAAGLFDAALNYLWDETIIQLRARVSQYDLSYFFDNAVSGEERRKHLKDASDLDKITDDELVRGAHSIGLVGEVGYKHLDYIRYMRNWVSAAHPNQNTITGLQLASWLETCIKEVITLPLSSATVQIGQLLGSIKSGAIIDDSSAKEIGVFFAGLTTDQVDSLSAGLFGIFVRPDSKPESRTNILKLFPTLWPRISENVKAGFGMKYGRFAAANDQQGKSLAHQILSHLGGLEYLPEDLKALQLDDALDRLETVHNTFNNFYNEPAYARQLEALVGQHGSIPKNITHKYVETLVYVFLTNGNGIANNAEPAYLRLIDKFDITQIVTAVLAFRNAKISSRLQFTLCSEKYNEMLRRLRSKASLPAVVEFIDFLTNLDVPSVMLNRDSRVAKKIESMKPLMSV